MKRNKPGLLLLCLLAAVAGGARAQDILPALPKADRHSEPIYPSREMKMLMRFVPTDDPMPATFRDVSENRLLDPAGSLFPFWEKLARLDRPLRIVHIGDSHVRGHVFPYTVRRCLEEDFGGKAVEAIPVSYQTSGIAKETGENGVVYHIMGVNGATCETYATPERLRSIAGLHPDMVIISFGTNEAHARNYAEAEHTVAMERLLATLKASCPDAVFLLTTPPGAYMRDRRRGRVINPRTSRAVANELGFAREHGLAVWDLYHITGGEARACRNWTAAKMYQRDRIHFTREGYILQGRLLHEALIKAYNNYVATGLD